MANILIIDDEKSIRITLKAFLIEEGYNVDVAEDAESALRKLNENHFDIAVSDIILPRVSGIEVLKQIKEISPDVRVIMMTGEPTVETSVEAVRAGASDYLTKPVGKAAILHAVRTALTVKSLEDDKRALEAENKIYQEDLESRVEERTRDLQIALKKLKQAQQQLIKQERMNALGQMASGIAHDFNNVLMPIVGFSDMILEDQEILNNREETVHMLELIRSAGEDARHIVRRLRQIYKKEDVEHRFLNLARIVESVLSITTPKWKEEANARGATIDVTTEFQDVPDIKGNASELREAFTNLIFNAVDAMPNGGTITIDLSPLDEGVILEVSDTGTGMNEETTKHCLEPFYTTKGVKGTGLGLSMVQGILQRHSATMDIQGQPGVGTTIRMRFPLPTNHSLEENNEQVEAEAVPPQKVLVVDDEERARDLVARLLRSDNHIVELAADGPTAVDMVKNGDYDIVITDRAMPLISGDELAARISKMYPEMPVIMLTGFGDIMKDKDESPQGVTQIMSKPVSINDLRRVMGMVLNDD